MERGGIYARRLGNCLQELFVVVLKGGGGSRWHKVAMWQMHIMDGGIG